MWMSFEQSSNLWVLTSLAHAMQCRWQGACTDSEVVFLMLR